MLFIADEIQSGLGRTGRTFACEHEDVVPDVYVLGKALGGGIVPVSAVVSSRAVLGVFRPGEHGSTFGGNPLACAVGLEVVAMLRTGEYQQRATRTRRAPAPRTGRHRRPPASVTAVRGRGLWAGVDVDPALGTGRDADRVAARPDGVLAKDTHGSTIRLAPPLTISKDDLDWSLGQLRKALTR